MERDRPRSDREYRTVFVVKQQAPAHGADEQRNDGNLQQARFDRVPQHARPARWPARVFGADAAGTEMPMWMPMCGSRARDGGLDAPPRIRVHLEMARALARGRAYGRPTG